MDAANTKKRNATDSNPLLKSDLLMRILTSVGPGHWLFLATVSSFWRDVYATVAGRKMQTAGIYTREFICIPQMTLYSSVFASPSLVHEFGVYCSMAAPHYSAARHGTAAGIAAAHELGMKYSVTAMRGAVECNELAAVQFLHGQGCPWDETVAQAAARRGHVNVLRWLREHGCDWQHDRILCEAARSGNIEVTAWVKQQPDVVCNEDAIAAAAAKGHTAMCEYLHAEQCPWNESACNAAASSGQLDTLRWLHECGCPWYATGVCKAAAASGSVAVMEYLREQNVEFTVAGLTSMLDIAGTHNHLAAAQWLRQQGAEWPAVLGGSLAVNYRLTPWSDELLAWARAEGCTSTIIIHRLL
jgi:hypothetical protein